MKVVARGERHDPRVAGAWGEGRGGVSDDKLTPQRIDLRIAPDGSRTLFLAANPRIKYKVWEEEEISDAMRAFHKRLEGPSP
jgi:hypothetical protein